MHKKTAPLFVHYGEPEKIKKSFAFNVDIFKLWDCSENYIDNNSLTVYIRRLRTKIEDNPGEPKRIVTVRGMGYKWNTEEPGI